MNQAPDSSKKSLSFLSILSGILTTAMFICALIFILTLRQLNMLPTGWFILLTVVLIALLFGFSRLMRMTKRKGLSILGMVLSLLCVATLTGGILMKKALNTLQTITTIP